MTKIADILENLKLEPMLKSDFRGRAPVLRFHQKTMFLIFQMLKKCVHGDSVEHGRKPVFGISNALP